MKVTCGTMNPSSLVLVKVVGQIPFWTTYWPEKHISSRRLSAFVPLRTPPPFTSSFSYSGAQFLYTGTPRTTAENFNITEGRLLYHIRPSTYHYSCLVRTYEKRVSACSLNNGLQGFSFSSAGSLANRFAEHEVSAFREFSAGLKAFGKGQFLESSQQFHRLYELVRQINQSRETLKMDTQLLVCGCLAAALFRQGAYERAEELSKEMLTKNVFGKQSNLDPLPLFDAYRAFATIVATSAAFECMAQKQLMHTEAMCHSAAEKEEGNTTARNEKKGSFLPMQTAKLCLRSVLGMHQVELLPSQPKGCVCLRALRIFVESLTGAGPPVSLNPEKRRNCVQQEVEDVLYDFLNLIDSYNRFVLQTYTFLEPALARRRATGEAQKELTHFYFRNASKLLSDTAEVLERLESPKQKGNAFRNFDTLLHRDSSASCRQWHEAGTGERQWKIPEVGTLCKAIIENDYAVQVVVGIIQLYRGVGSCLIRICAEEDYECQSVNFAGSKDPDDGFTMGRAALKKGLALCKQYDEIDCRMIKGGLLAALADSFRCSGDAVVSEGLFRSALTEFAAATGLQTEKLIEAAAGNLSQTGRKAASTAPLDPEDPAPIRDDPTRESLASRGSFLTFADRFEYASAMLQYSFLLTKWEGREFEGERLRTTAAKLLPVLADTSLHGGNRSIVECWVFSLLWKPPVNVALCLSAGLSGNSLHREKISQSNR